MASIHGQDVRPKVMVQIESHRFRLRRSLFRCGTVLGWGSTTDPSQIVYTGAFAVGSAICFASMGYYYGRLVELDLRILDSGDDLAKRQLLSERVTDSKQNSQYWLLLAAIFVLGGVAVLLVSTGQQTARISLTMVLFAGAIGSMFGWYHETVKGAKAVKELGAA